MVECHKILSHRWRTGCILQKSDCQALITNYRNRLTITVTGDHKQKREFMSIIRHLIDDINSELTDKPRMLIPLPDEKGEADYLELLEKEKDGERNHTIYRPVKKRFEIAMLLEGITNPLEVDKLTDIAKAVLSNTEDLLCRVNEIKSDTTEIRENQYFQFEYLEEILHGRVSKEEYNSMMDELLNKQSVALIGDLMDGISNTIELMEEDLDEKLIALYEELKKTDDVGVKLKLSVPILNLLGLNIESEIDIKSWAKKMYEKHKVQLFQTVGALE
jgi:hypothetical protein